MKESKLKKAIFYIYYRLLDMHSKGEDISFGAFLAIVTISILFWLNIFSFIGFFRKIDLIPVFFNKTGSMALGGCLFILDYLILFHKKRYEKIIQIFKDESKHERHNRGLLVVLYVFMSVVVFILVTIYKPGKI
jgi:hypothetical protein